MRDTKKKLVARYIGYSKTSCFCSMMEDSNANFRDVQLSFQKVLMGEQLGFCETGFFRRGIRTMRIC